ncbi:hypothetical protein Acr_00g0075040 [Actinidia rufa]|uniref:Uncharacterized protein n=1 Tax=Actinidia rufa TaxID=165716 RepID=A0A7J0DSP3_9ERIC|nr:hypothetical protein Acr_00g0075040 [Actinidia rufa]
MEWFSKCLHIHLVASVTLILFAAHFRVPKEEEIDNNGCGIILQIWQSNPKLVLQGFIDMITIDDNATVTLESQVLNSGELDMDYLGKILEFALTTLQKHSAQQLLRMN